METINKRRATVLSSKHKEKYPFLEEFKTSEGILVPSRAWCKFCQSDISVGNGGEADIKSHINTKCHQERVKRSLSSKKITSFFPSPSTSTSHLNTLAAQEAAWCYHTARHNLSFAQNDCSSELIRESFLVQDFKLGRTKTSAIIRNVIGTFINDEEIIPTLNASNFLAISTDASNHGNKKMLPFIVRTFNPISGVRHLHLSLVTIKNELSVTIHGEVMNVLNNFGIKDKVVAYSADNAAVNFGSESRGGTNNVFRHLQKDLNREIFGIGCSAHVAHNAARVGLEILDIDFEALAVNIYKYFSIYTKRVENFKLVCENLGVEFLNLEHHSSTRFLTLLPALKKIHEMYEPLKKFFDGIECRKNIQDFFADPTALFWLKFIMNHCENFNNAIKFFEKTTAASFQSWQEYDLLKTKVETRMNLNFMTTPCTQELEKLSTSQQNNLKTKVS